MKLNATVLAVMVVASTTTAAPEPEVTARTPWSSGVVAAYKMKRAAYDINDILKRYAETKPVCNDADSICEAQRMKLDDIAEAAMDGYDAVSGREAVAPTNNKLPWHSFCGPSGGGVCKKNSDPGAVKDLVKHCAEPGSHCLPRRSAKPESRIAKRYCNLCPTNGVACPEFIKEACFKLAWNSWWRMTHPKIHPTNLKSGALNPLPGSAYCGPPGSGGCEDKKKRDILAADQAAARHIDDTIHAIRDAVHQIKRDVEAEKVEESADDFYADVLPYFQELETRVNDAVAATKA